MKVKAMLSIETTVQSPGSWGEGTTVDQVLKQAVSDIGAWHFFVQKGATGQQEEIKVNVKVKHVVLEPE